MRTTRFALMLVSCLQIAIALFLLTYSTTPSLSNDAFAWCDNGCGGCGMYGADSAACGASECIACGCTGYYDGTLVEYTEDCPGLNPE